MKRGRKTGLFVKKFKYSPNKRRKLMTARPRRKKNFSLNTHRFSRYCAAVTEEMPGTELDKAYEFTFGDMVAYSEFSNLFDRYRIDRCVMTFQLINNPSGTYKLNDIGTVGNSANFYPKMWYIPDHDDATAESIGTMKERVGVKCRILQLNKTIKIVVRPVVAAMVYQTSTATGYGPKWGQWIDMTHYSVPHYGLKVAFDSNAIDPVDTQPFKIRVEKKYYFTCKDVR